MSARLILMLLAWLTLLLAIGAPALLRLHGTQALRADGRLLRIMFCVLALCLLAASAFADIPHPANAYRALLTRTAHAEAGLSAPVATYAAQIQQESSWNTHAASPSGAQGLAQFMPGTARWISQLYPRLAPADVFNPGWALRALVRYDQWLYRHLQAAPQCDHWAMTLAAYNGGLGWVYRDQRLASSKGLDQRAWFDSVARVNAGRSIANWQQNRDYPRHILLRFEPIYVAARWGPGVCSMGTGA